MRSGVVRRLACVDVPAFSLQLLALEHPDWRGFPSAVVSHDAARGEILHADRAARRAGIAPGQRYAAALSLCPELRAGAVSQAEVERGIDRVLRGLLRFSPSIEPVRGSPGCFLIDATGLRGSLRDWARAVCRALGEDGLVARAAVGFTRLGVYAAARTSKGAVVFERLEEERAALEATPLARMGLPVSVRRDLWRLGVETIGALLALGANDVLSRFGAEAHHLLLEAKDDPWHPLEPQTPSEPLSCTAALDFAEEDRARLVFLAKRLLDPMTATLARRGSAIAELELRLTLDHAGASSERIRPAEPTLDPAHLVDLVRLRLEALSLPAGVTEMALAAKTTRATAQQLRLFREHGKRDLQAADRAFARVRARFGDGAVVRARLTNGHLPEASFAWEPMPAMAEAAEAKRERAKPEGALERTLVRRIHERPIPLGTRPVRGPAGVHLDGLENAPVVEMTGPYVVSGGWWRREVHREYHFARTAAGRIFWIYFDRRRRRWFLQGEVE